MIAATLSPSSTKVKFHLAGGAQPLILLPVRVNQRGPFDFILDTGAGTSLIAPEPAKQLGIAVLGSKDGHTAGGKVSVSLGKAREIAVGAIALPDVDLGIVDLAQIGRAIGAKIDGDLGYNFLKHFRVAIDYRNHEIGLEDPRRIESFTRSSATEVAIALANPAKPLILVDVHANGRGPFRFAIDTGTSTSAMTSELAKELGLSTEPVAPVATGGGSIEMAAATLRSFQLGGARIDNMSVVVGGFLAVLSGVVGTQLDGIVGYNFLRNYKVAIDYPNGVLSLS